MNALQKTLMMPTHFPLLCKEDEAQSRYYVIKIKTVEGALGHR